MSSKIQNLTVQITRFIDDRFPGWVECEFMDAEGRKHRLIDKVPIFSTEALTAASTYPQFGIARCEVLTHWQDARGRELSRVTTARPDDIESTEGVSEFIVLSAQLSADSTAMQAPR
jgi:hypothetical protein